MNSCNTQHECPERDELRAWLLKQTGMYDGTDVERMALLETWDRQAKATIQELRAKLERAKEWLIKIDCPSEALAAIEGEG